MTTNNLGGAHVWTLDMDDFGGSFCSSGAYPLINHLRMSMGKLCSLAYLLSHLCSLWLLLISFESIYQSKEYVHSRPFVFN